MAYLQPAHNELEPEVQICESEGDGFVRARRRGGSRCLGAFGQKLRFLSLTHESYPKVREECERLMLGHFSSKNRDFSQRIELTDKQTQLFAALGLKLPPKILCIHPRT